MAFTRILFAANSAAKERVKPSIAPFELAIEAELAKPMGCVSSKELGKAFRIDDAAGRYIEFCKGTFPNHLSLAGLKIVVDSAHGAAYHIAPNVYRELGAEVISINDKPNGGGEKAKGITSTDNTMKGGREEKA